MCRVTVNPPAVLWPRTHLPSEWQTLRSATPPSSLGLRWPGQTRREQFHGRAGSRRGGAPQSGRSERGRRGVGCGGEGRKQSPVRARPGGGWAGPRPEPAALMCVLLSCACCSHVRAVLMCVLRHDRAPCSQERTAWRFAPWQQLRLWWGRHRTLLPGVRNLQQVHREDTTRQREH